MDSLSSTDLFAGYLTVIFLHYTLTCFVVRSLEHTIMSKFETGIKIVLNRYFDHEASIIVQSTMQTATRVYTITYDVAFVTMGTNTSKQLWVNVYFLFVVFPVPQPLIIFCIHIYIFIFISFVNKFFFLHFHQCVCTVWETLESIFYYSIRPMALTHLGLGPI